MKHIYLLLATLVLLVAGGRLQAQTPTNLGPLLDLFTESEQNNFTNELHQLGDSLIYNPYDGFRLSNIDLTIPVDSLFFYLGQGTIGQTDSLTDIWSMNQDMLNNYLGTNDVSPVDSSSLTTAFTNINNVWNTDYDSLNTVITSYQDSLSDANEQTFSSWATAFPLLTGDWLLSYNQLLNNQLPAVLSGNTNQGVDSLTEVLDSTLFANGYDFEMAFGQEWSQVHFWGERYSARSSLVRIATVPRFNQTIETRWAIEGSFFNSSEDLFDENSASLDQGINPFICSANFAMMYLPRLATLRGGKGDFRIYTSVGMDLGTYAPSHANSLYADRVGNTTGYGPQIGAGFVLDYSDIVLYSYATYARGNVVDAENYKYNASTLNAGIRLGNAINVRYTLGESVWAVDDQKRATFSRLTVGVILDSLRQ